MHYLCGNTLPIYRGACAYIDFGTLKRTKTSQPPIDINGL